MKPVIIRHCITAQIKDQKSVPLSLKRLVAFSMRVKIVKLNHAGEPSQIDAKPVEILRWKNTTLDHAQV